jgi:predicted DNA-binding transcriptional regulator YafY
MASQLARIFFIDHRIRTRKKVTIKEIVDEHEVSEITAKRDIEAMRDRLNAPIVYDRKLKGYTYKQEFKLLNFAGEQLFLFYVLAKGITKNPNYLPLTAEYSRNIIISKIDEILPDQYLSISDRFIYWNSDYEKIDFNLLNKIITGLSEKKKLLIYYFTKNKDLSKRYIEPLKVICYGTKWYLAAYCYLREEIRLFSISRIDRMEVTDKPFEKHISDKEVDNILNQSFGIAKSKDIKLAKIKFYEPSSYYVKNLIWHNNQKTKEYLEEKGKITEFTIPYSMPEELVGKVLKYGPDAEILEPKELRDYWLNIIKKTNKKYVFEEK